MRRKKRGLWIFAGGVGAGIALLVMLMPRERLLLDCATFIARTEDWNQGRRFNESIGTHWLNDEEVLFDRFNGPKGDDRIIYRRNIRTKQEQKLDALTKIRDEFGGEVIDSQAVSPDGKWFLCSTRWGPCLLAAVDGSRQFLCTSKNDDSYRSVYWLSDSRHWLEALRNNDKRLLFLHDVEHPEQAMPLPIPEKKREVYHSLERVLSMQEAIAIEKGDEDKPRELTISRFSLDKTADPVVQKRTEVPFESQREETLDASIASYETLLSPRGDRLACWGLVERTNATQEWLHRFLPSIKPRVELRGELWVCDLTDGHWHEIGHIVTEPTEEETHFHVRFQWLPGGKRLSFQYKDALYTVPAD